MRKKHKLRSPKRSMLCLCLMAGFGAMASAQQPPGQPQAQTKPDNGSNFNEEFLRMGGDQPQADLSLFAFGNQVMPGQYLVDVYLNQNGMGKREIRFDAKEGKRDAVACLTRGLLDELGVNVEAFPAIANAVADATGVRFADLPLTPDRIFERLGSRHGPPRKAYR